MNKIPTEWRKGVIIQFQIKDAQTSVLAMGMVYLYSIYKIKIEKYSRSENQRNKKSETY